MRYETWVNLIILDMVYFDVILGMGWSATYNAVLNYFAMILALAMLCVLRLGLKGDFTLCLKGVISFISSCNMV